MAKVIVERPRTGGGARRPKGCRKRERLALAEQLPAREGCRRRWTSWQKSFNEHLGPLRRYLQSQVGRPWSKVHSEISRHIRVDSTVQRHVLEHLWQYVETETRLVDGVVCDAKGQPLARCWGSTLFYVCPKSGLLKATRRTPRPRRERPAATYIPLSPTRQWHRIHEIWYEVHLAPLAGAPREARDAIFKTPLAKLSGSKLHTTYGSYSYATTKRQLGKREARRAAQRLLKQTRING